MRRLALAAVLLAACGDSGSDTPIDAATPDAGVAADARCNDLDTCNVVEQTGCSADDQCTMSHVGSCPILCAPDGTQPLGEACTIDPATQLDDCLDSFCTDGLCRAFCVTSPDSCDPGFHCVDLGTQVRFTGTCIPD